MGFPVILGLLVLLVVVLVSKGIKIIRQGETKIVERLGRYHSTLPSGINVIWPIIDKPRSVAKRFVRTDIDGVTRAYSTMSDVIDLREQVFDFPEQSVITKDNVTTRINALLYFQITDPF